jgi:hypoxanthine-DNA glycosylase
MEYPQNLYSFPPVVSPDARVLILGSMPGIASLKAGEYYAHPRNAFWPIMARCLGFDPALEYTERLEKLQEAGIALWDVLYSCRRAGSSDTAIEMESTTANPVATLLRDSSGISVVMCNGTKAATLYKRFIAPDVAKIQRHISYERLPSTSPAHARMNFTQKLHIWHTALQDHLETEVLGARI